MFPSQEGQMSESGSSSLSSDEEIDDPGRDPKGMGGPPRNPFGGGSQSGGDRESGPGTERDPLMPAEPEADDNQD
jgi:hypothetical protein